MKVWSEPVPKFDPSKATIKIGEEHTLAEGTIEVERRRHKSEVELFDFEDYTGLFTREHGATNFAEVERILVHLNGCKVKVSVTILEFPKADDKGAASK